MIFRSLCMTLSVHGCLKYSTIEVNKYIYGWLNYIGTRVYMVNMSEYSIVGLTVTQCVHSLQVFICLPVYAYLWGQIQCEEMTVAVSAVVGSMLTRITR